MVYGFFQSTFIISTSSTCHRLMYEIENIKHNNKHVGIHRSHHHQTLLCKIMVFQKPFEQLSPFMCSFDFVIVLLPQLRGKFVNQIHLMGNYEEGNILVTINMLIKNNLFNNYSMLTHKCFCQR